MASLELRNQTYRVVFMYSGRKYGYSLNTSDKDIAEGMRGGVKKTLMLIAQGALILPDGENVVEFVRNGGKITPPQPALAAVAPVTTTLGDLKQKYLDTHRNGAMEANSLQTTAMHLGHFGRTFGDDFELSQFTLAELQRHVNQRTAKLYRGKPLSAVTLRKEMDTLRAAWNWASLTGLVDKPWPGKGLVYPKTDEKPPFQTWKEIERQIAIGGLDESEAAKLWECLFLLQEEVTELLEYVKANAAHSWIFPAIAFAAHTGARRSEVFRARLHDVDFEAKTTIIREKKRAKAVRTTRRVPLSPFLLTVLRAWLAAHPGGQYLFCQAGNMLHSKKRSRTTGHQHPRTRATTDKGRMATLRPRETPAPAQVTVGEAHSHFQHTMTNSKWEILRGWHVLRHSFISNCAAKGVDQRLIDDWVGHTTEAMRRRYRHLVPSVEQAAIRTVFG